MKALRRLEEQTPEDFAALGQGAVSFLCRFPDGRDYTLKINVKVRINKRLGGIARHGELDVFSTDWALKSPANGLGHKFRLAIDCTPEQFGIEMQKAVQSLPRLLTPLSVSVMAAQTEARNPAPLKTPRPT